MPTQNAGDLIEEQVPETIRRMEQHLIDNTAGVHQRNAPELRRSIERENHFFS